MPNNQHRIRAVVKDKAGVITAYQLENGEVIMKESAITMAKGGAILGVTVGNSKNGEEYLKALADDTVENNLVNLPAIDESEIM